MASVVARQGRSDSFKSRQRNTKAVVGASDDGQLASAFKEKVASGGKSTPAKELLKSLAAGGIQPSPVPVNEVRSGSKTKGKGKITNQQSAAARSSSKQTPEQKKLIGKITAQQPAAAMSSVKQTPEQKKLIVKEKMKQRYGGIGKALVEPDGEMHLIVMDEQEYETAASLIDHTCQKGIDCSTFYTGCRYKEEAAGIHF